MAELHQTWSCSKDESFGAVFSQTKTASTQAEETIMFEKLQEAVTQIAQCKLEMGLKLAAFILKKPH